jgi:uncharacterized protein (DUF924 family)
MEAKIKEILDFWFVETTPEQWFQKNESFDSEIKARFEADYKKALGGEYDAWQEAAKGALALSVLLDQFPRNMYRNTPKAFEADAKALSIAKKAVAQNLDEELAPMQAFFLYLPFEHSENLKDQEKSLNLFSKIKQQAPMGYDYALKHYEVIKAYGRFPHRNDILGRENTPAEEEYLARPDSGF